MRNPMSTYTLTIDKPSLRALLACVSHPKHCRTNLESIAIDGSKFIATDGHRVLVAEAADVFLPVVSPLASPLARVRVIPVEAYKTANRTATNKSSIEIKTSATNYDVLVDGKSIADGKMSATIRFPPWEQVVPGPLDPKDTPAAVVGLNPLYVADLALVGKATRASRKGDPPTVRMEIRGELDPVVWRVTSYQTPIREWTYVLMPKRL